MKLHKVYHRFPSFSFTIHNQNHNLFFSPHRFSLSPPSSLSLIPCKFPKIPNFRHFRSVDSGKPLHSTMSRLQSIVPVEAVAGENVAAVEFNGSASKSQYEGNLFHFFPFNFCINFVIYFSGFCLFCLILIWVLMCELD